MNFKHVLTIFLIPLALFGSQESLPKKHQYYDLVTQINGNGKNVSRFIKEELQQNERSLLDEAVKSGALTQNNYDDYFKLSQALWIRNKLKIDQDDNQTKPIAKSLFDSFYFEKEHSTIIKEQFEKCRIHSPLVYAINPLRPNGASARRIPENINSSQLIKNPVTTTIKLANEVAIGESLLYRAELPFVLLHEYGHLKRYHLFKQSLFEQNTELEKQYNHLSEFEADLYFTRKNGHDVRGFANYLIKARISVPFALDEETHTHPTIAKRYKRLKRAARLLDAQQDYYKNIATSNPGRAYDEAWLRAYEKQKRREAKKAILAPYRQQLKIKKREEQIKFCMEAL